jgi:hypothetical protein
MQSEAVRQSAVESILERNPNAFRPKIQVSSWSRSLCPQGICGGAATLLALQPDLLAMAATAEQLVRALVAISRCTRARVLLAILARLT